MSCGQTQTWFVYLERVLWWLRVPPTNFLCKKTCGVPSKRKEGFACQTIFKTFLHRCWRDAEVVPHNITPQQEKPQLTQRQTTGEMKQQFLRAQTRHPSTALGCTPAQHCLPGLPSSGACKPCSVAQFRCALMSPSWKIQPDCATGQCYPVALASFSERKLRVAKFPTMLRYAQCRRNALQWPAGRFPSLQLSGGDAQEKNTINRERMKAAISWQTLQVLVNSYLRAKAWDVVDVPLTSSNCFQSYLSCSSCRSRCKIMQHRSCKLHTNGRGDVDFSISAVAARLQPSCISQVTSWLFMIQQ